MNPPFSVDHPPVAPYVRGRAVAIGIIAALVLAAVAWLGRYQLSVGAEPWILDRWTGEVCRPSTNGVECLDLSSGIWLDR